jgi:hypothetical protein
MAARRKCGPKLRQTPGIADDRMVNAAMNELKVAAANMLDTPDPNDPSLRLTPSWEYLADPGPH